MLRDVKVTVYRAALRHIHGRGERAMISISDFVEQKHINDAIIQMALREIDTRELSHAMIGFTEEERQIVLRNMSERACKLLAEEIEYESKGIPKYRIESATESFLQRLRKHARYLAKYDEDAAAILPKHTPGADIGQDKLPDVNIDDEQEIVETFVAIQQFVKRNGILALEGIEDTIANPVMRKGIEYFIDGWEPLLMQTILEAYKKTYIKNIEKKLEMILVGIDSLASKDSPLVTEERLRSYTTR